MDYEEKFKYLIIYLSGINDSIAATNMDIAAIDLMEMIMHKVKILEEGE